MSEDQPCHSDTTAWTLRFALAEAKRFAVAEYSAAFVFRLCDGSYGWANCHPSWGWLRDDENIVAQMHSDGALEALNV